MLIHKLLFGTRPSILKTEVYSFQVAGIEEFHCNTEVSSFQVAGIEEFHCNTEVSSFQVAGIEGFYYIQKCPAEVLP